LPPPKQHYKAEANFETDFSALLYLIAPISLIRSFPITDSDATNLVQDLSFAKIPSALKSLTLASPAARLLNHDRSTVFVVFISKIRAQKSNCALPKFDNGKIGARRRSEDLIILTVWHLGLDGRLMRMIIMKFRV
jgi:hypothetical protein